MCAVFEVSRSGYYAWCARAPSVRQAAHTRLLEALQRLRQGEDVSSGSPRLTEELKGRSHRGSENRAAPDGPNQGWLQAIT